MPPSNSSCIQQRNVDCIPVSSNCVIWQGDDIPELNISNGMTITVAMKNLADSIIKIKHDTDLSTLDICTLTENCLSCPDPDKTVKTVISLIIAKIWELESMVGQGGATEYTLPNITLSSCLAYANEQGDNVTSAGLDVAFKLLMNKYCATKTKVDNQTVTIINHEDRIIALETKEVDNKEGTVASTCVFTGTKPITDAYELLDLQFCQLRAITGTVSELNQAFSKVTCQSEINAKMNVVAGWKAAPRTLADYIGNFALLLCNHEARVTHIEDTCCKTGCDDIVIGFIPTITGNTVVLSWTQGSGLYIPEGFEDCGTRLTITDDRNHQLSITLAIEPGEDSVAIDLSQFTKGDKLHFNFDVKMCMDGVVCQKCYTRDLKYTTDCCVITNTGDSHVVIVYETTI